jgi:hypothetical protein
MPDFTRPRWQASRGDARLKVSILEGRGTHMPPFRDKLTDEAAGALVAHIRQIPEKLEPAREGPQDDFATRFAQLEKEFRELQRQFYETRRQSRDP